MPRQNAVHTDGPGHTIHASDVAAPDLYLAQLSRQTYLVEEFGAKQDGATDDTTAVQAALTAAGVTGGRVVVTNPCRCAGQLTVPPFVFLDCGQAGPQRGPYGQGTSPNILGPSLLTTGNAGQTAASAAFLTLGRGSAFRGIILHPNQTMTNPPVQYPPAIVLANGGEGAILKDVLLVNPYIGVYSVGHGKPYIDGLYGQALNLGLYLDQCYDIARIRNVHWWNFWKAYVSTDPLETYQRQNLTTFYIGRVDGLHAENWLSYGHYIGVLLTQVANGPGSGAINKLWLDGGVHGVAATAVGYQGMTIRDSVIYSQYKDASNNPGYCVLVSANATALDRLTFDGFDFNLNTTNNPSAVLVGSGVTGGRYAFRGGAFESYTSAAVVCQSAAASLSVRAAAFRGSGSTILDISTLSSGATGVYEVADCEYNKPPVWSLPATLPPGLSIDQNRAARSGVVTAAGAGAKGDGTSDDRAALAAADARNGGAGVTVLAPASYRVASNLTFANPVQFQPGAKLVPDSGVVVTFNHPPQAGPWQIVSGSGTLAFASAARLEAYPEWWGAKADGSTANDSFFSAANTALSGAGGGVLRLGGGVYCLATLWRQSTQVAVKGAGIGVTTLQLTASGAGVNPSGTDILLSDLTINGNGVAASGLAASSLTRFTAERVRVTGCTSQPVNLNTTATDCLLRRVELDGNTGSQSFVCTGTGITLEDCLVNGDPCTSSGVLLGAKGKVRGGHFTSKNTGATTGPCILITGDDCQVEGAQLDWTNSAGNPAIWSQYNANRGRVIGCRVTSDGTAAGIGVGGYLSGSNTITALGWVVSGNETYNTYGNGVLIGAGSNGPATSGFHTIAGNRVDTVKKTTANTAPGIEVDAFGCAISGNTAVNCDGHGLYVGGPECAVSGNVAHGNGLACPTPGGIKVTAGDCALTGNVCSDTGASAQHGFGIIVCSDNGLDVKNVVIKGNRCLDTRTAGSKLQDYGLYLYNGANSVDQCDLEGNDLIGNNLGALNNAAGTHRIRNNRGFNPQGPLAVTPGASPWTYTAGQTPETLHLYSGAVSGVTKGGVTLATATPCQVQLEPGDAVIVTYSAAPTAATDRH